MTIKNSKPPQRLVPSGNHLATCIQLVDLGTSEQEFSGKIYFAKKIQITWEIPDDEKPFIISKEYTQSLNEKATLRHHLESWRGKAFTEEELQGFNISRLLGKPCMLNVIHKTSKLGNTYAEVISIASLPRKTEAPEFKSPLIELSFEDSPYKMDIFEKLPDFLKEKIKKSDEWRALTANIDDFINDDDVEVVDNLDDIPF
jgi:hypothetical protein